MVNPLYEADCIYLQKLLNAYGVDRSPEQCYRIWKKHCNITYGEEWVSFPPYDEIVWQTVRPYLFNYSEVKGMIVALRHCINAITGGTKNEDESFTQRFGPAFVEMLEKTITPKNKKI